MSGWLWQRSVKPRTKTVRGASYARLDRDATGFCGDCGAPQDRACYGGCRRLDPHRRGR